MGESGEVAARKSASFVSFAVHTLTGWLPGCPWSLSETANEDPDRLEGLVQEIIFGGVAQVLETNIPDHNSLVKEAASDAHAKDRKFTKKQLKAEARKKKADTNSLLKAIFVREQQVEKLDTAVKKTFSEWFFVTIPASTTGVKVLPILALAYSENKVFDSAQILVEWVMKSRDGKNQSKATDISLPPSTPIDSSWLTISDIRALGALVQGVDTRVRVPNCAELSLHWSPFDDKKQQPAQPHHKKDKETAKEKPTAGSSASKTKKQSIFVPDIVQELQEFAPTLLRIDTSECLSSASASFLSNGPPARLTRKESRRRNSMGEQFRNSVGEARTGSPLLPILKEEVLNSINQPLIPSIPIADDNQSLASFHDTEDDGMVTERTALSVAKDSTLCRYLDSRLLRRKRNYISVSIFLHEDVTRVLTQRPGIEGTVADVEGTDPIPAGSVLVLQEVRSDTEDPLVMRIQLGAGSYLPMKRVTFNIPVDRLTTQPVLFWCRLFSTSSLYVQIHCTAPISLRPAEEIWQSIGRQVVTYNGDVAATAMGMERVLFRTGLQLENSKTDKEDEGDRDVFSNVNENEDVAMCFLTIVHKSISPFVSVVLHDDASKNSMQLPVIEGNLVSLSKAMKTLIVRCFNPSAHVPAFSWKFVLLHKLPLIPTIPPQIDCLQRLSEQ